MLFGFRWQRESAIASSAKAACAVCSLLPWCVSNHRCTHTQCVGVLTERLTPMVTYAQAWLEMLLLWVPWGCASIPPHDSSPSQEWRRFVCGCADGLMGVGWGWKEGGWLVRRSMERADALVLATMAERRRAKEGQ